MTILTAIIEPDADGTLHLPLPSAWRHQTIRVKAELEPVGTAPSDADAAELINLRGFGCLRGKIWMAPDFDEPLEDFKDYTA
ncbi:MAG: DUF2281 domain-containing protein [Verrucomicrobia bacterium]|nr:DUF2281 domain-containing protein [Verrucomicrobiota bacterium]